MLGLAAWLKLERIEWAVLILTISSVWVAEFFNTALEVVVDLASPDIHHLAKIAKDVGAASVLVAAFFSVVIGILVLGPPLFNRLANFFKALQEPPQNELVSLWYSRISSVNPRQTGRKRWSYFKASVNSALMPWN